MLRRSPFARGAVWGNRSVEVRPSNRRGHDDRRGLLRSRRDLQQIGRRNTPTLSPSASVGENCGRHNLEVFRPPTSRRWVPVRVSTARASGQVRIRPIRGRAGELKVIGALISAVAEGRGGVLVIEGPPGIGKSRLLTEVSVPSATCSQASFKLPVPTISAARRFAAYMPPKAASPLRVSRS